MFYFTPLLASPEKSQARASDQVSYPCSVVLQPVKDTPNALGTALIAQVEKPYTDSPTSPVRKRQSVGIYADWLPSPSSFGNYDQYEGFARIPDVISWRFKMYSVKEDDPSWFDGTAWVGKFDEISSELPENAIVQVRLSNSKTNKLGPVILQNSLSGCRN
ncbi:MAG TPA: hypothetical protein VF199_14375 [Bacillales bacterium]